MKRARKEEQKRSARETRNQSSRLKNPRHATRQRLTAAASDPVMYKHAGRWLSGPKHEHEIVLRATEIANRALQRVVTLIEVVEALMPKEIQVLEKTYEVKLNPAVSKILGLLCARGLVFSSKSGFTRYYGVVGVLNPASAAPPTTDSRRRRVLKLVYQTVQKLGRAARMSDILEHAATSSEVSDLSPTNITSDVLSLKQEGELRWVGSIRGDGRGFNLYLPSEFTPEDYMPSEPLTWLQAVARTFGELWAERTRHAVVDALKPRPLSTAEVRAYMEASSYSDQYPENLADPMVLINALQQLAKYRNPVVRKIKRPGHKAILWAPADVGDDDLDIGDTYANDIERICEAVRRAEHALARPVRLCDVKAQVKLDVSLQPRGSSSISLILSEAAKARVSNTKVVRRKHATKLVHRVGKIADVAYYSTSQTPAAKAFVEFGRLELRWSAMRAIEELNKVEVCSLPCVATGRVLLIASELSDIMRDLARLRESGYLCRESLLKAAELYSSMTEIASNARAWLDRYALDDPWLPRKVDTNIAGWTADELLTVIKPFYPRAQKLKKSSELLSLIGDAIRRVNNRTYVNRFSKDQHVASEYLFDRADALIYIAKEWGGYECSLQATLAGNELGLLRDPRFVLPALESENFNARLSAIACLAFLRSEFVNERLRIIAISDPDPGVRQSALWAYGFAGGTGSQELLVNRSKEDKDSRVRTFAQNVLDVSQESWWIL
jgi:hypothetical protein